MTEKCTHPLDNLTFHDCTDLQETRVANNQPYVEPHCDNKDHCTVTVCGDCGEQVSHDKGTFDALEGPKDKTAKVRAVNPNLGKMFD